MVVIRYLESACVVQALQEYDVTLAKEDILIHTQTADHATPVSNFMTVSLGLLAIKCKYYETQVHWMEGNPL